MSRLALRRPALGFWSTLTAVLFLVFTAVAYLRFTRGLGAVTNLSDGFPWGLWIGFDVLCGVGLAAGGFAITATVHILHLDDFKPIVRPTILTAFLGYLLVIIGLLFDLGKPWNIWHPIIMWNPHSVMFEVGWCVMLYTTVLSLEFSPIVLERFKLSRLLAIVAKISPILVIAGVVLSTLHQSSLGSLFLILPEKVHPLWYSPMLPVQFFVSAVAAGLGMTVVESWFSRRAFRRPIETQLLARLSRVSVVVLALFLVMRMRDLMARDAFASLFPVSTATVMFALEIGVGVIIPMVLLSIPRVRATARSLALTQGLVVLGFIMHRLNVSITAVEAATGRSYVPAIPEFLLSISLVAGGMTVFCLACKYLPVFPKEEEGLGTPAPELIPIAAPHVGPVDARPVRG